MTINDIIWLFSFICLSVGYGYMVVTDDKPFRIKAAIVNYLAIVFCLVVYLLNRTC